MAGAIDGRLGCPARGYLRHSRGVVLCIIVAGARRVVVVYAAVGARLVGTLRLFSKFN